MQTAADCNVDNSCSSNNSNNSNNDSLSSAGSTPTSMSNGSTTNLLDDLRPQRNNDETSGTNGGSMYLRSSPMILPARTSAMAAANELRHRATSATGGARAGTGAGGGTSARTTNYKYNVTAASSFDTAEYMGSNVEQMSVTPSPSPQASPSKTCKSSTQPAAGSSKELLPVAAAVITSMTTVTVPDVIAICNNSSSSSSSNSNSNSTTSSVIATPTLQRNGVGTVIAKAPTANAPSFETVEHRPMDHNERLTAMPMKPRHFMGFSDGKYLNVPGGASDDTGAISEMSTPLTPSSISSNSPLTTSSPSPSPSLSPTSTSTSATPASNTPATAKQPPARNTQLLQWKDMPQYLQFNPYVLQGYRPLQTFKGCLLSLFYWHNETINILTHAIPIVYILAIVPGLMPWEKGYRFLSFCHVFGSVAPWCGSFVYHLFMNIEKGENVYYRLLKLDMVGIWVSQSFGALPLVAATTFCFSTKWKWSIIISYCLLSLWGLYKALTATSPWQRRLCFALPFTMRTILTFLRTLGFVGGSHVAISHVFLQDGVSILGGAIGAMRIPEKWFPGLVDFYLNSHNIMHVLVVVAVYSMHKATIKDFEWMSSASCDGYVNATTDAIDAVLDVNTEL